jgi:hypothetical protein
VSLTDYACPPGTFTDSTSLRRIDECSVCPAGSFCPLGTGGPALPPLACFAGYFCPLGTTRGDEFACPPGSYSSSTSLTAAEECTPCPAGQHCVGGGNAPTGPCSTGHYCPLRTARADDNACPAGTYTNATSLAAASQCDACDVGRYCEAGTTTPVPCPAGSFANTTGSSAPGPGAYPACVRCPAGYECSMGSVNPSPCGVGRVSDVAAGQCVACHAGYYCDEPVTALAVMKASKQCPAGLYCGVGTDHTPALATEACPVGMYCPTAAPLPILCAAGTFNPSTGQATCQVCAVSRVVVALCS